MKLAVMQPYLFPYLGYYQLCYAADKFVFYDDVTYIKQGYINRNSINNNGSIIRFVLPVPGASSNVKIMDLKFSADTKKILQTIKQSYSKSEHYKNIFPIIESVFNSPERDVAAICKLSIQKVFEYLGLEKELFRSSELSYDRTKSPADRLIEMANNFECKTYINSPGGVELYEKSYFLNKGVNLKFIRMNKVEYKQNSDVFLPNLSMIDVLMNCDRGDVLSMLKEYSFF